MVLLFRFWSCPGSQDPTGTDDGCSTTELAWKVWEKKAHIPPSAGAQLSWAAVQPDMKLFYFGPP